MKRAKIDLPKAAMIKTDYLLAGLAVIAAIVVSFKAFDFYKGLEYNESETVSAKPESPSQGVDVCVITFDFGDGPRVLWSNQKANATEDGTITITTTSTEDF